MVFCSKCGKKVNSSDITCDNCGSLVINNNYFKLNKLENFNEIASAENLNILKDNPLTSKEYDIILNNIYEMAKFYQSGEHPMNILDKIKAIVNSYVKVTYKSKGAELGSYSYNIIKIDDRLNSCDLISTLIHELTHHLFNEIFEQMLMYVWEVEKSDALEAYVSFMLGTNPVFLLMNEYCAHTVEGRFIPHGYQNYGSFNNILIEEFDLEKDKEAISFALVMGNSIASDIINILEKFITHDLRMEIKTEFQRSYNKSPNYEEILLESDEILDCEDKLKHMHIMLMSGISLANMEDSNDLFSIIKNAYILNNS